MGAEISCTREGDVAIVRIAGGPRGNALSADTWDAFRRVTLQLSDAPPRMVVLTGEAHQFSTGLDLSPDNPTIQRLEALTRGRDAYAIQEHLNGMRSVLTGFGRLPCPVIAAIEGACLGAGFELVLSCDLRIASSEATFGLPEVGVGLVPMNGGLVHLARLIGQARTAQLVLSGRHLSAAQADALGLLNEVCPPGEALARARELAAELRQKSHSAVQQTVLALRRLDGSTDAYGIETQAAARAVASGDFLEGLLAHRHGRQPRWNS